MSNPYLFKPSLSDGAPPYAFFQKFFTNDECDYIIDIGERCEIAKSGVAYNPQSSFRRSKNSWIKNNFESEWIYRKLEDICRYENSTKFMFELGGFYEDLQYTVYDGSSGDFYKCHRDSGPGILSMRKLSLVLMLSHPQEYEGGDLEIFVSDSYTAMPKEKGTLILFPSYEWHRVTEVTKGKRRSLVSWVSGPPLR
jgi:PKHD-type hydroxylase